jgi:chromate reductase, NAD(P)H dehydrogenase (quinone)
MSHRILCLCGALRAGSTNRKLLHAAMQIYAPADWAEGDLRLPLYDGDEEAAHGIPTAVQALADAIAAADGVVISTPEYNRGPSGVLKNALDWVSRTKGQPFKDKPVAILSAADGVSGGVRAQFALRLALVSFRPRLVAGPDVALGRSGQAFAPDGRLTDAGTERALTDLMGLLRAEIGRG